MRTGNALPTGPNRAGGFWHKKQQEERQRRMTAFNRQQVERERAARATNAGSWRPTAGLFPGAPAASRPTLSTHTPSRASRFSSLGCVARVIQLGVAAISAFASLSAVLSSYDLIFTGNMDIDQTPFLLATYCIAALGWKIVLALRRHTGGNRRVAGEARGVELRMLPDGNQSKHRLSFLVERYDGAGNRQAPVPVELEGKEINGYVHEGDHVEVAGRQRGERPLRVNRILNVTTRTAVRATGSKPWGWILVGFAALAFLFLMA